MIARGPMHVVEPLTERQRAVLACIARYYDATGEVPTLAYVARRLSLHHSRVQEHLRALYRKGWLRTPETRGIRCTHVG